MRPISHPDTHVFLFDRHNWEGWKLGTKLPSFYSHHDGTCHFFEGVAVVDQMRKTKEGRIEVIVRDYQDEEAASRVYPYEHPQKPMEKAFPQGVFTSKIPRAGLRIASGDPLGGLGPIPFRRIRRRRD